MENTELDYGRVSYNDTHNNTMPLSKPIPSTSIVQTEAVNRASRMTQPQEDTIPRKYDDSIDWSLNREQQHDIPLSEFSPQDDTEPDTEDEEFETLIADKRKQIRADIARLELELTVYESRLRDQLRRKKKRKEMERQGRASSLHEIPRSPNYSIQPAKPVPTQFLPLLDPAEVTTLYGSRLQPTSPVMGNNRGHALREHVNKNTIHSDASRSPLKPMDGALRSQEPSSTINTALPSEGPPKQDLLDESISNSPVTPKSVLHLDTVVLPKPVFPGSKDVDLRAKLAVALPSSLSSSSSWTGSSAKNHRKNPSLRSPGKRKRVIFQFITDEGDCMRVRPDGEEIPVAEAEKEKIKLEVAAAEEKEEEERLRVHEDLFDDIPDSFNDQAISTAQPILATLGKLAMASKQYMPSFTAKDVEERLAQEKQQTVPSISDINDQDWVLTPQTGLASISINNDITGSFSEDEDDLFDLDEEIPLHGRIPLPDLPISSSLEESVLSLGLPFAPAPPPPPPGSSAVMSPSKFGLRRSNSLNSSDFHQNQRDSRKSATDEDSLAGSYISSSLPYRSYSLVNPLKEGQSTPKRIPGNVDSEPVQPKVESTTPRMRITETAGGSGELATSTNTTSSSLPSSGFKRRSMSKYLPYDDEDTLESKHEAVHGSLKGEIYNPSSSPALSGRSTEGLMTTSIYGSSVPISIVRRPLELETTVNPTSKSTNISEDMDLSSAQVEQHTKSTSSALSHDIQSEPDVSQIDVAQKTQNVTLYNDDQSKQTTRHMNAVQQQQNGATIQKSPRQDTEMMGRKIAQPSTKDFFKDVVVQKFPTEVPIMPKNEGNVDDLGASQLFSSLSLSNPGKQYAQNPVTSMSTRLSPSQDEEIVKAHKRRSSIIITSDPVYASISAAQIAADAAEKGDVEESYVGGLDGRSGLDASSVKYGSQGFTAESLRKSGMKPESMSFSMRMALEGEV